MSEQIPVKNVTPAPAKDNNTVDLYASRGTIYTRAFTGLFRNVRMAGGAWLFILYFGTVWLNWGDRQAVWWDLPGRKFYIFGATFWPQDFVLLSWLLIICAFGLFFITVFAGRVWCGYTCPQSVWTWIFMWCEKVTEGDRNQRMKLDKAPMSKEKLLRKVAKHSLWLLIGLATGLTFVGYFAPIRELLGQLMDGTADGWAYFWIGLFTLGTYGNAGWLREQVCIYMCPYARFQSVMFDKDTLIVSYDPRRGEHRGPRKKTADYKAQGLGDCIDCTMCVQVCPTGIDIRDGLQYECIGCGLCVDACNTVMDKMQYPRGLIRYSTQNAVANRWPQSQILRRVLRPRVLIYSAALLALCVAMLASLSMRTPLKVDVVRDRAALSRIVAGGKLENIYRLQIMNATEAEQLYRISAGGLDALELASDPEVTISAADSRWVAVRLQIPYGSAASGSHPVFFEVQAVGTGAHVTEKSVFLVPR